MTVLQAKQQHFNRPLMTMWLPGEDADCVGLTSARWSVIVWDKKATFKTRSTSIGCRP
jgi:glycerol kinase